MLPQRGKVLVRFRSQNYVTGFGYYKKEWLALCNLMCVAGVRHHMLPFRQQNSWDLPWVKLSTTPKLKWELFKWIFYCILAPTLIGIILLLLRFSPSVIAPIKMCTAHETRQRKQRQPHYKARIVTCLSFCEVGSELSLALLKMNRNGHCWVLLISARNGLSLCTPRALNTPMKGAAWLML